MNDSRIVLKQCPEGFRVGGTFLVGRIPPFYYQSEAWVLHAALWGLTPVTGGQKVRACHLSLRPRGRGGNVAQLKWVYQPERDEYVMLDPNADHHGLTASRLLDLTGPPQIGALLIQAGHMARHMHRVVGSVGFELSFLEQELLACERPWGSLFAPRTGPSFNPCFS